MESNDPIGNICARCGQSRNENGIDWCYCDSIRSDMEEHPELTPLLDINSKGEVECFGWVSPIRSFDPDDL